MATKAASKRLGREAQIIEKDPPPFCYARPREDNVLEWHFILRGPPDTPYHGGEYWGQLIFPSDYPFKPPGIKMSTPSGRFKPDTKICTSFSDFHVGSWNPSWSVANILVGLLSFMCADEMTTGSVSATSADRQTFAQRSHAWNIEQRKFKSILPEYSGPTAKDLPNMGQQTPATAAAGESSKKKEGEEGKSSNKVRPAAAATNEQNYVKDAGEPAAAQSSKSTAKETLNQAGAMADTAIAQAPPARVNAGWRMLDIGRRKIAFAVALLAYLFVSRLVSGGSATNGAA